MVFDSQLLAEVSKCIVVKLFAIVRDEDSRIPKRQMMFFQTKSRTFFSVMVAKGSASTHLVK